MAGTKTEISEQFAQLRKFGFKVWNGNTPRPKYKGEKGLVDHIIFSEDYIIIIEVKLPGDTWSDDQEDLAKLLKMFMIFNPGVKYKVIENLQEAINLKVLIIEHRL